MKTKIIVDANIKGFKPFEISELKYIPRKGEIFKIDEKTHPIQAEKIAKEEKRTGIACCVWYVENEIIKGTSTQTIILDCIQE